MSSKLIDSNTNMKKKKICIMCGDIKWEVDEPILNKSPYFLNCINQVNDSEDVGIIMPKWVIPEALEFILHFLRQSNFKDLDNFSDKLLQRILWLSDFLKLDEFQYIFVKEKLIPSLNSENSLLFLSEAFKKLKSSDNSSDCWYVLFNFAMNTTAKNLKVNYQKRNKELLSLNEKILEEVIERYIKRCKNSLNMDQKEAIELLMHSRKKKDIFMLLNSQKETIKTRKTITSKSQPSITWRLTNITKLIEKETNTFKFSSFTWKLIAKKENVNNIAVLSISLKYDNNSSKSKSANNTTTISTPNKLEGILSLYYTIRANGNIICGSAQIKSFNIENEPIVPLCKIPFEQLVLDGQNNEFIFFLNLDYVHSAILTHISKNIELYYQLSELQSIAYDDIYSIIFNLTKNTFTQECGLKLVEKWVMEVDDQTNDLYKLLKAFNWEVIQLPSIINFSQLEKVMNNHDALALLQEQSAIKLEGSNNQYSPVRNMTRSFEKDISRSFTRVSTPKNLRKIMHNSALNGKSLHGRRLSDSNSKEDLNLNAKIKSTSTPNRSQSKKNIRQSISSPNQTEFNLSQGSPFIGNYRKSMLAVENDTSPSQQGFIISDSFINQNTPVRDNKDRYQNTVEFIGGFNKMDHLTPKSNSFILLNSESNTKFQNLQSPINNQTLQSNLYEKIEQIKTQPEEMITSIQNNVATPIFISQYLIDGITPIPSISKSKNDNFNYLTMNQERENTNQHGLGTTPERNYQIESGIDNIQQAKPKSARENQKNLETNQSDWIQQQQQQNLHYPILNSELFPSPRIMNQGGNNGYSEMQQNLYNPTNYSNNEGNMSGRTRSEYIRARRQEAKEMNQGTPMISVFTSSDQTKTYFDTPLNKMENQDIDESKSQIITLLHTSHKTLKSPMRQDETKQGQLLSDSKIKSTEFNYISLSHSSIAFDPSETKSLKNIEISSKISNSLASSSINLNRTKSHDMQGNKNNDSSPKHNSFSDISKNNKVASLISSRPNLKQLASKSSWADDIPDEAIIRNPVCEVSECESETALSSRDNEGRINDANTHTLAKLEKGVGFLDISDMNLKGDESGLKQKNNSQINKNNDFLKVSNKSKATIDSLDKIFTNERLVELRKIYNDINYSKDDKIGFIKACLYNDKEILKNQIFDSINIHKFVNKDKIYLFA